MSDSITLVLTNGKMLTMPIEMECGGFVVHHRVEHEHPADEGWTVTHRTTTLAVWTVHHMSEAVRVAQWLDKERRIPESAEECLAWKHALKLTERTKLIAALQTLAPRWAK